MVIINQSIKIQFDNKFVCSRRATHNYAKWAVKLGNWQLKLANCQFQLQLASFPQGRRRGEGGGNNKESGGCNKVRIVKIITCMGWGIELFRRRTTETLIDNFDKLRYYRTLVFYFEDLLALLSLKSALNSVQHLVVLILHSQHIFKWNYVIN